jgi:hypothetical protein
MLLASEGSITASPGPACSGTGQAAPAGSTGTGQAPGGSFCAWITTRGNSTTCNGASRLITSQVAAPTATAAASSTPTAARSAPADEVAPRRLAGLREAMHSIADGPVAPALHSCILFIVGAFIAASLSVHCTVHIIGKTPVAIQ